jgi:hypothetical protein
MPGHTVILAPDASLGAAKVVTVGSGVLRKEMDSGHPSFIFPLGDAANSSPAAVDCTGSSFAPGAYISATVTAEAFSGRPAGPDYLNRTWVITQSGLTNINCATLFQYVPGDVTGTEANLYGLKSHNSLLTDLGPVDTVNHTFGGTVTEFSTFTAGSSAPTAVTLTNIDLQASGAGLLLHWQTAQEVDLVGFQVERSASPDGQPQPISAFMPVQNPGSLEGADYSYLDTPLKFAQTYRYWIVIFSAGGTQQQIGPFSAQAGGQVYLPVIVK